MIEITNVLLSFAMVTASSAADSKERWEPPLVDKDSNELAAALQQAKQSLEVCQRRLDCASEAGRIGIWEILLNSELVYFDSFALGLLGLREGSSCALADWAANFREADRARFLDRVGQIQCQGESMEDEFVLDVDTGETRHLRISGRPFHDVSGKLCGVVGTILDVTEQKRTTSQIQRELEMVESGANAQSHFLARMSHEIRTPMNAILAPAQLLSETVHEPGQKELVGMLLRAGEHLLHVINTILDFSKLEAGKMVLKIEPFEVERLVAEVLAPFAIIADGKEVELSHDVGRDASGFWVGDPARIRQILLNLVSNAVKFTCGGQVAVRVSPWSSEQGVGGLEFEIQDSGPGISLDETERIFLPFEQSPVDSGSRPGGTGLGLAICRELVDLMGGILGVDSVPGEGSQFWFRIPLQKADPEQVSAGLKKTAPIASTVPEWKSPPSVLIVEDNPSNRKVISLLLKKLGCGVSFAADGYQALEALALSAFDLVLMDCEMPGMNGYECVQKLRAKQVTAPVVALSAHVGEDHNTRCLEAGMNDVLSKPISLVELRSVLSKHLPHQ